MNDKLQKALEQLIQYNVCMCEGGDSYDPLMADYHVQKAREILTEALAASKQEPQAQAGPEVVAWPPAEDQPITLGTYLGAVEAIAKKDAALKACVEALHSIDQQIDLSKYPSAPPDVTLLDELRAAITQAEGVLK